MDQEVLHVAISYLPFEVTLVRRRLKKEHLIQKRILSRGTSAKISRGDYVALEVIDRLCGYLDCRVEEVIEYVPDQKKAPAP